MGNLRGDKRQGAGSPKEKKKKNITFRVPIIWVSEIKKIVKERMTELRNGCS